MDQPLPAAHHSKGHGCSNGTVLGEDDKITTNENKKGEHRTTNPRTSSPSVLTIPQSIQQRRIKEVPTRATMGPRHRPERRSTIHPHQLKHSLVPTQARGAQKVPQRAPRSRDDMTVEEPLCHCLLLHKEKEREVEARTRLQTHQHVDHPKQIPTTINPPADLSGGGTMWCE